MGNVSLRRAIEGDITLLRGWERQPHVVEAGIGGGWKWEDMVGRQVDWREVLIAEVDGRPIGFVHIVDPAREETHYWGDCPDNLRAIDIWIGEPECLGCGYGTEMMLLALERCFADPMVEAVLVDPVPGNLRARRFYESIGFRFVRNCSLSGEEAAVYRFGREEWDRRADRG